MKFVERNTRMEIISFKIFTYSMHDAPDKKNQVS